MEEGGSVCVVEAPRFAFVLQGRCGASGEGITGTAWSSFPSGRVGGEWGWGEAGRGHPGEGRAFVRVLNPTEPEGCPRG